MEVNKRKQQLLDLGFTDNNRDEEFEYGLQSGHLLLVEYWEVENFTENEWGELINECEEEIAFDNKMIRYRRALYCYGITPMLILLKEYEDNQNFEECQLLYKVICDVNSQLFPAEEELQTRYDKDSLDILRGEMQKYGFTGETAISNMSEYIQSIKDMVNENN